MSVEAPDNQINFNPENAALALEKATYIRDRLPSYVEAVEKMPLLGTTKVPTNRYGHRRYVTAFQFIRQQRFMLQVWEYQLEQSGGHAAVARHLGESALA